MKISVTKETKRERVKDTIREYLIADHYSYNEAYEVACILAERVFDALGISDKEQDKP